LAEGAVSGGLTPAEVWIARLELVSPSPPVCLSTSLVFEVIRVSGTVVGSDYTCPVPLAIADPNASSLSDDVASLYDQALPSARTGPLYNAFSYPTKISPEAIALFIATHTKPDGTVLDVFAGSGTTGLAVKLCDSPTPSMVSEAARLGINPEWGPRNAVLYDVGVLASFISEVMCNPPDPERFEAEATELLSRAEKELGWLYATIDPDGLPATVRHIVWSDVLGCPLCGQEVTYWDAAVSYDPLRLADFFVCDGCKREQAVSDCERLTESYFDRGVGRNSLRKRRVPVQVYGRTGSRTWQRPVERTDLATIEKIDRAPYPENAPRVEIEWGDLYRSGYHEGISHLHHFYTPRNFLAISTLWRLIDDCDADMRDALRLLVLSFNASHSTLMTRVVLKKNQKDFVLTGAQSGVLYISGLPVEKNVFVGVARKIKTFKSSFEMVHESRSQVEVVNSSSTLLDLRDESVDYVFTDPPFGDFIPYAELSQINEAWLGNSTNREQEAIISGAQGKDVSSYGEMMKQVFAEVARVLRNDGVATVVFHSAKASVWRALTDAYGHAGFRVRTTSVLGKTQASFKQVISPASVKDDPLILLDRDERETEPSSIDEVFDAVVTNASKSEIRDERGQQRMFSRFITRCLLNEITVTMDASEFYSRLKSSRVD
jgi:16S rRNA G966 N2-methylase RsmD